MSIAIHKVLVDQRFRSEVSLVVDELRLAQDLMMIMGIDVSVKFSADEAGVLCQLDVESVLPESVRQQLKKQYRFKTIRGVFFIGDHENEDIGVLDISFFSRGAVMSKGILHLSISGDEDNYDPKVLQNFICLAGYPRPIFSNDTLPEAEKTCKFDEDNVFNENLTRDTFEKLPDKLKQSGSNESVGAETNPEATNPQTQVEPEKTTKK